jgi:hypothetical protein
VRGRKRSVSGKNPTSPPVDTATVRLPAAKLTFSGGGGDASGSPGSSQRLRGPEDVGKTVKHGQPTNGGSSIVEKPGTSKGRKAKEELVSRVNDPRTVTESGTPTVGSKAGEEVCEMTYIPKSVAPPHCSLGDTRPPLAEGATIHAREAAEAMIPPKLKNVNKRGGGRNPVRNVTVLLRRQKMMTTIDGDRLNKRQDCPGELVAEVSPPRGRELEAGRGVGQEAATGVKAGPPPCPRTSSGERTPSSGTSDENRKARKRKKRQEDPVEM